MALILLIHLSTGALVGLIAGLFGVGGGLIIVPLLVAIFTHQGFAVEVVTHLAVGTSLATIVITSISSIRAHQRHNAIDWSVFRQLVPGIVVGSLAGASVAKSIPGDLLARIFGLFELAVAVQMALALKAVATRPLPRPAVMAASGGIIGAISTMVGVGGGTMTVPFLSWHSIPIQRAIATAAACGLPIAVAGGSGMALAGLGSDGVPSWSIGFIYLPALAAIVSTSVLTAPVGARLAHRLPAAILKRAFSLLLLLLGLWMLSR